MRWFLLAFAILSLSCSSQSDGAGVSELSGGSLTAFEQLVTPQLEDCGRYWRVKNQVLASCDVVLTSEIPSILVQSNTLQHRWRYQSEQGWSLNVWLHKLSNGYRISIDGDGKSPMERLQFPIARKYVRSLLEDWGTGQFRQRVMRPNRQVLAPNEQILGPVMFATRKVQTNLPALFNACQSQLRGPANARICVIHFADYSSGEVVLSEAEHHSEVSSVDGKTKLRVIFGAKSGWRGLGPFSLAYMRVENKGSYNEKQFQDLYRAALKKINLPVFSFQVQKIGASPTRSSIFSEQVKGPLEMVDQEWQFSSDACRKNWQLQSYRGFCAIQLFGPQFVLAEQQRIIDTQVSGKEGVIGIVLRATLDGYIVEAFGPDRVVGKFEKVEQYVKKAVNEARREDFRHRVLVLPQ
jgi:hypothetical protein